jgi:cytochrome c biogenesis protein CcmG, thiol:disulfide interchange protein DsbE
MPRFLPVALCGFALIASLTGCGGDEPESAAPSAAAVHEAFAGAPAPLAAVHAQANALLDGDAEAFERQLRKLRGHPVVVNKWASWCGPCRDEFPYFQRAAVEHAQEIAFLGVSADDPGDGPREFLERFPLTYPSYRDPRLKVSAVFNGVAAWPTTAFYDSRGELAYVKQGVYLEEGDLAEDIERYAR